MVTLRPEIVQLSIGWALWLRHFGQVIFLLHAMEIGCTLSSDHKDGTSDIPSSEEVAIGEASAETSGDDEGSTRWVGKKGEATSTCFSRARVTPEGGITRLGFYFSSDFSWQCDRRVIAVQNLWVVSYRRLLQGASPSRLIARSKRSLDTGHRIG